MRKIFFRLAMLIVVILAIAALWIFQAQRLSLYLDRFGHPEDKVEIVHSIRYEGSGNGGALYANEVMLSLNTAVAPVQPPSVGSTADGKLALAAGGKVFPLGPLTGESAESSDRLTASPEGGDDARIILGHSLISWPTPFDFNFMSGSSPSWKRHTYQMLMWNKPNGMKLKMLWRYEQNHDSANGWTSPTMTREGQTGLIKVEITQ